jgi:uracil-DNA glycosylase family 4
VPNIQEGIESCQGQVHFRYVAHQTEREKGEEIMTGFFSESELLAGATLSKKSLTAKCGLCRLYKKCESPKIKPSGKGKRNILIVGEAPGKREDEKGEAFVGQAGKLLRKVCKKVGLDLRRDCTLTNALICRPPNNATPTDNQIEWCNPNLQKTIKEVDPDVIITVGKSALQSVLFGIWEESMGLMGRWVGWKIPLQEYNTWVVPTYHPSYVMRQSEDMRGGTAIPVLFKKHLKQAAKLKGKPYKKVPNWKEEIKILYSADAVCRSIQKYIDKGGAICFDFETDMLKPDHKDSSIISASICWKGKETIAFPWSRDDVKKMFRKLMLSKNPKIAHNRKFEDRWYHAKELNPVEMKILGKPCEIVNWAHDTMVNTHIINCHPDINSLEFQALVSLGLKPYSKHISPLLEQRASYKRNRIKEISMDHLLTYNGLDSLVGYKLCEQQRKYLNLEPL